METSQRATVTAFLVLVAALAVVAVGFAPAVAAQETNSTEDNMTFGAQVSAFMQSSAADANGTVDRGVWNVTVTNASNPGAVVSERARKLNRRIDVLEARNEELDALASDGGPVGVVYTARASAVRTELSNLRQSVNQTSIAAVHHGVDDERLAELRRRAGNVSGPEIAAAARTLTGGGGGPPEWVPGGPDGAPGPPGDNPGAGQGTGSGEDGPEDGGPPDGDQGNDRPGDGGAPGDGGSGGGGSGGSDGRP